MRLRRLGWAGIELEAGGETLVVDHVLDVGVLAAFLAEEREQFVATAAGRASAALITHLHRDHADPAAVDRALSAAAPVLRPAARPQPSKLDRLATGEAEQGLAALDRPVLECGPGDAHAIGPFAVTALPASDGLGSPQVSWVVEADGQRVVHAGDTLWHGGWWDVALAHGPIDVACLPGNGVEIAYPGWDPPAQVPAVLTPFETVAAARALAAGTLVPIHYDRSFEHPDHYRPVADAAAAIRAHAAEHELNVAWLAPGEWAAVAELAPAQSAA